MRTDLSFFLFWEGKNPEVVGLIHAEVEKSFQSLPRDRAISHFLTRANAQREIHGFTLAL